MGSPAPYNSIEILLSPLFTYLCRSKIFCNCQYSRITRSQLYDEETELAKALHLLQFAALMSPGQLDSWTQLQTPDGPLEVDHCEETGLLDAGEDEE